MAEFRQVSPYELKDNFFERIGRDWMLVTARDPETGKINTMTASWGCTGILWNKPVAIAFIRPQRHTFGFTERAEVLSLSFFDEEYKDALRLCGRVSGREHDKIAECGFTVFDTESGIPAFAEARMVLGCKKLYADFLREDAFLSAALPAEVYELKDYHKMYICEIVEVYKK